MPDDKKNNVPRGMTLLEALERPATPTTPLKDIETNQTTEKSAVKGKSVKPGKILDFATRPQNSARKIIAAPETEREILNALGLKEKHFAKLVEIAKEICEKTLAIEREIAETQTHPAKKSEFPNFATGAIVLFNVIQSIGILAERLLNFRDEMLKLDQSNGKKNPLVLAEFDKKFAVYLAHRMNVNLDYLCALPESDLHICHY